MWLALLSLHLLGIVGYNLFLRKSVVTKIDRWFLATLLQTGIGIPALILLFFFPTDFSVYTSRDLLLLTACVILGILLHLTNVKALQYLETSIYSVVYNARLVFITALSALFLSEQLTPMQLIGGILIFISVFIVRQKATHSVTSKGLLFGFTAAITLSFLNVIEKTLNQSVGFFGYFLPAAIIGTIIMWVILLLRKTPISGSLLYKPSSIRLMLFRAFSAYGFSGAIVFGPVIISNFISSMSVVLLVLCGIIFLHERDHLWKKLIATAVAVVGLYLVLQ